MVRGGRQLSRPSHGPTSLLQGAAGLLLLCTAAGLLVARIEVATYAANGSGDVGGALLRPGVAGALVLFAVGTVLLVFAVRAGRRVTSGRPLLAAGVAVSTLLALVVVGVPTAAAAAAVLPPRGVARGTGPAAAGLAGQDVRFTTSDGVRLAGWWSPGTNGAAVVLVPGTYGTRSGVVGQAVVLARHGYGVLLLDPRGSGASDGPGNGLGWYLERDIGAAVSFLLARPEVRGGRVGVLGESLGGEGALGAAAADPRIRAVVAEGVTGRTAADDGTRPMGPLRPLVVAGRTVVDAEVRLFSAAPRPVPLDRAVAASGCPVLLVAAGTRPAEVRTAERARRSAAGRVVVDVVPGAAHAGGLSADPRRWETTVVGFLDGALGP